MELLEIYVGCLLHSTHSMEWIMFNTVVHNSNQSFIEAVKK